MTQKILFLCTGNYYRSRFAEEVFNHLARQRRLPWAAESRGLAQDIWLLRNPGPISPLALRELKKRAITPQPFRFPKKLKPGEAGGYQMVVAMDRDEHQPLIEAHYPDLKNIIYWNIKDLGDEPAESALQRVETNLQILLEQLASAA